MPVRRWDGAANNSVALIFVYNADSGIFNTIADIGRKMTSPDTYTCRLCALTHGYFTVRREWKEFVESLNSECEFLHRDEFIERYGTSGVPFPAIFLRSNATLSLCLDATDLNRCETLAALKELIKARCGSLPIR